MLDLKTRPRRRQGVYWASVIVSIIVHGGFLAYLLAYARLPAQLQPRPRATGVNVEVIGTTPFEALRRGDREKMPAELRAETSAPPTLAEEGGVPRDAMKSGAPSVAGVAEISNLIGEPLPEDRARAAVPQPRPDRLPKRRIGTGPSAIRPVKIALHAARPAMTMTVPARRMAQIAREARLSERRAAEPPDDALTPADAMALPPLKLLVASGQADPGSEDRRASALNMEAQASPVVAELPKEAGIAMFAARIVEGEAMLPEDRAIAPAPPMPTREADGRLTPPKGLGTRLAAGRGGQTGPRLPPAATGNKSSDGVARARTARAYRLNIRAHLTANRPGGGPTSGRAVVAFRLTVQGGVRSVRIARSSGSPALDRSVVQAVHRAAPFPKPPPGLKPEQLRFVIPFEFR